jgi:hypothetical protein
MAFTIQLRPDLEEILAAEAQAAGLPLQEYVQKILEQRTATGMHERKMTLEEFEAALDAIGQHSDKIPELPPEALTREGIYRDHD